ncbi:MAG: hypothetical protein QOH81_941 [Sphingomonadales bacterium]|nr:hypothetical protein [Sphingomonadales bacterium]
MQGNKWLIAGGLLSAAAALLHIAIIFGGANWYRFFGAGEGMARAAEAGSVRPVLVTTGIAAILLLWALYAFSGAGLVRPMPLLRTGLVLIAAIYLLRAFAPVPMLILRPDRVDSFVVWSSLAVLVFGLLHAIGTWTAWPHLTPGGNARAAGLP